VKIFVTFAFFVGCHPLHNAKVNPTLMLLDSSVERVLCVYFSLRQAAELTEGWKLNGIQSAKVLRESSGN
jgi:hypothetical protein